MEALRKVSIHKPEEDAEGLNREGMVPRNQPLVVRRWKKPNGQPLSGEAKMLAIEFWHLAGGQPRDIEITYSGLATDFQISEGSIRRVVKALEEERIVKALKRRRGANGGVLIYVFDARRVAERRSLKISEADQQRPIEFVDSENGTDELPPSVSNTVPKTKPKTKPPSDTAGQQKCGSRHVDERSRSGSAAAEGGKGGGSGNLLQETNQTPPPSPSPLLIAGDGSPVEWYAIEDGLLEAGVGAIAKAVRAAKWRKVSPGSVMALVQYFTEHRQEFESPAALYFRIMAARNGQRIDQGWMAQSTASKKLDRHKAADAEQARRAAVRKSEEAELAADCLRQEEFETKFGSLLRLLSPSQEEDLLRAAFPDKPFVFELFRRTEGLNGFMLRPLVLEALRDRPELSELLEGLVANARGPPAS